MSSLLSDKQYIMLQNWMALNVQTPEIKEIQYPLHSKKPAQTILKVQKELVLAEFSGFLTALRTMRRGELAKITLKPKQVDVDNNEPEEKEVSPNPLLPFDTPLVIEVELFSFITKMEIGEELQKWLLSEGTGWDVPRFSSKCEGTFIAN